MEQAPQPDLTSSSSASDGGARGAALRESMRQSLRNRAARTSAGDAIAAGSGSAGSDSGKRPEAGGGVALQMAGRGEALRTSMRQLLVSKQSKDEERRLDNSSCPGMGRSVEGGSEGSTCSTLAPEEVDPWPEMPLNATPYGVEDGRARASVLKRQGDFAGAAQMYAKAAYIARHRCEPALEGQAIASLVLERASALFDADDFQEADRVCSACLRQAAESRKSASDQRLCVEAHALRARCRCELGDAEGARADISEALARHRRASGRQEGNKCDVEEQLRTLQQTSEDIENRLATMRSESGPELRARVEAQLRDAEAAIDSTSSVQHLQCPRVGQKLAVGAADASAVARGKAADSISRPPRQWPPPRMSGGVLIGGGEFVSDSLHVNGDRNCEAQSQAVMEPIKIDDTENWNEEFFDRMERDFADMCAQDGWDDRQKAQEEELAAARSGFTGSDRRRPSE